MRPITTEGLWPPAGRQDPGAAPMLQWIAIADLVVDDSYQRPIGRAGRHNVGDIAKDFHWSRFGTVVVSPVIGGKYAIVDGQHRTTAALLAGHAAVPCQVIIAPASEQARAFHAINGKTTRITALSLHKAAVMAGDTEALAIERVAAKAGVKVLRYPLAELQQNPGETMAIGTIADCLREHGEDLTGLSLKLIVGTRNNVRGGVLSCIIRANARALTRLPSAIREDEPALIGAFERINLIREMSKAQAAERSRGTAIWTVLADRLTELLQKHFGLARKAAA